MHSRKTEPAKPTRRSGWLGNNAFNAQEIEDFRGINFYLDRWSGGGYCDKALKELEVPKLVIKQYQSSPNYQTPTAEFCPISYWKGFLSRKRNWLTLSK